MLTFTEEILLLLGDDEGAFLPIREHAFECVLAGAVLLATRPQGGRRDGGCGHPHSHRLTWGQGCRVTRQRNAVWCRKSDSN